MRFLVFTFIASCPSWSWALPQVNREPHISMEGLGTRNPVLALQDPSVPLKIIAAGISSLSAANEYIGDNWEVRSPAGDETSLTVEEIEARYPRLTPSERKKLRVQVARTIAKQTRHPPEFASCIAVSELDAKPASQSIRER